MGKGPCQLGPNLTPLGSVTSWGECMIDVLDGTEAKEQGFHAQYTEAADKMELVALVAGEERKQIAVDTAARSVQALDAIHQHGITLKKSGQDEEVGVKRADLTPGDLMYYFGAFGQPAAIHSGVYIGEGWVVHFWMNPDEKDTETQQKEALTSSTKGVMVCTRLQEFAPSITGDPKQDMNTYVASDAHLDDIAEGEKRPTRQEAITLAASRVGEVAPYSALGNNCQHESVVMVTGKRKLLVEAHQRMLDALVLQLGQPDGINADGFGLDEDDAHTLQAMQQDPEMMQKAAAAAAAAGIDLEALAAGVATSQ